MQQDFRPTIDASVKFFVRLDCTFKIQFVGNDEGRSRSAVDYEISQFAIVTFDRALSRCNAETLWNAVP
jgi:hypothetical protein